ncbi:hypothetical protein GCM10027160_13470 [Streptomyces calidiresistens]|uniref:FAD-dependent oxidoreductase n=1 Tax=Streptomyces calidiresistens TaxID=1485586 RepID=A0A7W3T659_9ACTN|nr:FAD-dependent oxidoreductase [Streptomyces calidiresistens]
MPIPATTSPVHVIGGGPSGLATAAALVRRGIRTVVLERGAEPGTSWRNHWDGLRLHTTRRWSSLPGLPIPRSAGRWVPRDEYVAYLERYARAHRLELACGVEVSRIEPLAEPGDADDSGGVRDGGRWLLRANGGRELRAAAVVVATGANRVPRIPAWPGLDGFTGEFLHASGYRTADTLTGRDVLVVGTGNSGAEIAAELAAAGAGRVRLAVRTPPHIVRRSTLGWPAQASAVLCRRLPVGVVDRLAVPMTRLVPNLTRYGLPRPESGLYSRVREGAIPVQDVGLVRAVRRRLVEPVAAVTGFEGDRVLLADGGSITPEVVIAATGWQPGLEPLVGHLGVLDDAGRPLAEGPEGPLPQAPGLWFTGYTHPISGMLREIARQAPRVASAVTRELYEHRSGESGRRARRAAARAARDARAAVAAGADPRVIPARTGASGPAVEGPAGGSDAEDARDAEDRKGAPGAPGDAPAPVPTARNEGSDPPPTGPDTPAVPDGDSVTGPGSVGTPVEQATAPGPVGGAPDTPPAAVPPAADDPAAEDGRPRPAPTG